MSDSTHSLPPPPQHGTRWIPWVIAGLALITLGFAARAGTAGEADAGSQEAEVQAASPNAHADAKPADPNNALEDEDAFEKAMEQAEQEGQPSDQQIQQIPAAAANAVVQENAPIPGLSLLRHTKAPAAGEPWTAQTPEGKTAKLSINPTLQKQMTELFNSYRPLNGAVVALDPKTGKILALVEHSEEGKAEGLATRPLYPAASVFKIITGAALLDKGVSADTETCYHGGLHGIVNKLLQDKPRLDRRCLSMAMALAKSANVVFGKLAVKHLDAPALRAEAEKFLFNRPLWSEPSVENSTAQIQGTGLEFAKTAAGFGAVKLSPLHAALIAGAVGNDGLAMRPTLIDSIEGEAPAALEPMRLLRQETADTLTQMMKLTVKAGTATSYFKERRRPVLGDIEVAGKTGSLSSHGGPFRDYSWFVGFAPADDPKIAVAAVIVNGMKWRIHAPYVAREAMRAYFVGGKLGQPPAARASHHKRTKKKH
ncbi:MAG: penicillin-binding protein [Deltaproteobacteria bacterium]|nr:penicillin-binding protein [Deltaproteobacteria bacterium]